jgi:hypothetical protein
MELRSRRSHAFFTKNWIIMKSEVVKKPEKEISSSLL